MASIWYGIGISIGIALTGWFVSPMISFVLNKILSYLYDASKKVPELVADTIPDLKTALREVEEQWMLKKLSPDKISGVFTLEKLERLVKSLKAALYEAEDIVDLIDYHLMDAKARGEPHDTTWLQWCWRCLYNPIRETSALVLERAKQSWLGRWVHIVGDSGGPRQIMKPGQTTHLEINYANYTFDEQYFMACRPAGSPGSRRATGTVDPPMVGERLAALWQCPTWLQWCWRCLYNPIQETSALVLERAKQSWLGRWVHIVGERLAALWQCPTWLQWCWRCLYNPIQETSALVLERAKQSWLGRWVHIVGERLAALWQCLQTVLRWFGRWMHRSGAHLPIYSAQPSSGDFKNLLGAITNWFSEAYASAKDNRDRANTNAGFTRYEQDVDCTIMGPLCTHLKKNMRRIERLLDEASKCTSFTRSVQETIELPDQQRSSRSGNTPNFTNEDEHVTAYPAMKVTGRERVREQIRARLHDVSSSENVIGICGIPGSGKTTLAQYVYQYEKKGGHFDLVMWIHVSQNFSVDVIFRRMFEEASPNEKTACPPFNSTNALLTKLVYKINGRRLLLVLDDIWDNTVLSELVTPFKFGGTGSKILVTSRTESALQDLGSDVIYQILQIPPLGDKDFFELLMYYARVNTGDQCGTSQLHIIGGEIAEQLEKSPLAARVVGSRLSENHDVNFWRNVRYEKLLQKTTGALWWCYQHLDEDVKRCFAYCSIFPRGHPLFRDELVNLWLAEGFIRSTEEEEMEDVGQRYFRQLVSTSFLQRGVKDYSTEPDYYQVHDRLHDLAVEVAGSDCFIIENGWRLSGDEWSSTWTGEVHPDVRHLFILNYNAALVTEKILKLENLRTLIIDTVPFSVSVEYEIIDSIFRRLRKLRVLAISFSKDYATKETFSVPDSVYQAKHLRYLAFRTEFGSRVTFPSTPTKLYHMWLLDVGDARYLEFSCGDFANFSHVLGNSLLKVSNIGKMISLQMISNFSVMKEQGCKIKQLRNLNKLRGSLSVNGLENVASKVEALEANLAAKKRLRELKLVWTSPLLAQADREIGAGVLDGLCPPIRLETLHIHKYGGLRYPNWMLGAQNGGPKYLQKLQFSHCIQQGPPPQLAFIHLQELKLSGCSWNALPGNMENLTSLKLLLIESCPEIRLLPTLPHSIEEFTLSFCNDGFMRSCENKEHSNWQKIKLIPKKNIIFTVQKYRESQGYVDPCYGLYMDIDRQPSTPRYDSEGGYRSPRYDSADECSGW